MYSPWITPVPRSPHASNWPDSDVVARRVDVGPARLADLLAVDAVDRRVRRIDLDGRGRLVLDGPLARPDGHLPAWSATARLEGDRRRPAPRTRVHLWISSWSPDAVELRIRPGGHPHSWGRRRRRRYFDLAHLAADELRRSIIAAADERSEPSTATGETIEPRDRFTASATGERPEAA